MMNASEHLFLGIDGGGTKTASVIIDSHGRRVAEGMGGPSNSFHNPIEIVVQSVQDSVQSALAQVEGPVIRAGCVAPRFEGIVDYLSNALSAAEFDWIGERRAGFAAAGIEREMGVVIIAGTGSSFHAVRADGTSKSAGGWGSLLGDEGSAFDIAVQAIKKGLRAIDGRGPATALSGRLQSFFAQNDDHAFVHATTIARLPRNHIARFAAEAVQGRVRRRQPGKRAPHPRLGTARPGSRCRWHSCRHGDAAGVRLGQNLWHRSSQ